MIVAVKLAFVAATLSYGIGLWYRHRNNPLHRRMMAVGFMFTLGIAVVLVVGVHGLGQSYGPASWLLDWSGSEEAARRVLLAHRAVATLTLVMLIAQILTGLRRHPLHRRLARATISLWLISFVSGLVIFV